MQFWIRFFDGFGLSGGGSGGSLGGPFRVQMGSDRRQDGDVCFEPLLGAVLGPILDRFWVPFWDRFGVDLRVKLGRIWVFRRQGET